MCQSNDRNTICGHRYSHLIQPGTRFTFGPQCRTTVQDHIIRNRLTPLEWRKNFDELLEAMYLTQHGAHIVDLMRTKVETGLRARIRHMVNGGLIKEEARNGNMAYTWRDDADNFLGLQGWWKDWSPATSQRLAREAKTSSTAAPKPPKGKASTQKQYLDGNHVLGGQIGSNAIAGVGRDVNLRQTIYVYRRDDSSSSSEADASSSSSHESDMLMYENLSGEDDDSYDNSDDGWIPVAKAEDNNIVMADTFATRQPTSAFLAHPSHPYLYQQFINNCNHSCNHHQQPQNHVVPELMPGTPPSPGSSSDLLYTPPPSFVSNLHTASPSAPISLSSDTTLLPSVIRSSDPVQPSIVASGPSFIWPQDSASGINLLPRDEVPLRTSIDRRAIQAWLQDCTQEQLLQIIDELSTALIGDMIWKLKVLGGPDDPTWLPQDLHQRKDRHLDMLDIVCEEVDARLGLGYGEGVLALSWWWLED